MIKPTQYKRKLNTGGTIGSGIGALGASFIPGIGPVLGSKVGGAIGTIAGKLLGKKSKPKREEVMNYATQGYRVGGTLPSAATPIGAGAVKYNGPKHESGGIPIDGAGNPTNANNAAAEVEGGETRQDDYIFSDELIVPGKGITFADFHEQLVKQGADQQQIQQLAQLQEQIKQQQGIPDMPEMQDGGKLPSQSAKPITTKRYHAARRMGDMRAVLESGKLNGSPLTDKQRTEFETRFEYYKGKLASLHEQQKEREATIPKVNTLATDLRNRNLNRFQVTPNRKNGGRIKYNDGGFVDPFSEGQNMMNTLESIGSSATPETKDNGFLETAQRILPSLTRVGMAAFAKNPQKTRAMRTPKVATRNPAFTAAKNTLASGFRANPTKASYAQYIQGTNQLTASQAQDTLGREQINTRNQFHADAFNISNEARDADMKSQTTAKRFQLLDEAVQAPLTAAVADRRGREQQAANVITAAFQISDPISRRNAIRTGLKAIGLTEAEINKRLGKLRFGGKLK